MDTTVQKAAPASSLLRWAGAAALVFFGSFAAYHLTIDGFLPLAGLVTAIVIFLFLAIVKKSLSPYRWLATGLVLAVLFTVFPIFYTVYLSFTNMSAGHLLTKEQAVARLSSERMVPEGAKLYSWEAYQKGADWLLLLTDEEGKSSTVRPGQAPQPFSWEGDVPVEIQGYQQLDAILKLQSVQDLSVVEFGAAPDVIMVADMGSAAVSQPRFRYDGGQDTLTEITTGTVYKPVRGTYTAENGDQLIPGYMVATGADNYTRFLGNEDYFKPIVGMVVWNIAFSLLSVLISFGVGMVIALLFENLPGKRLIRALLIIPYPIPVLVSLMVWRGLLNENMGLVTNLLAGIFGTSPQFFSDVGWARFAVILINVYLSYPYFFILCAGALKSIPRDLYEAAEIDGATPWVAFKVITLPMLMRILMPLLIASFSFNFNNFTIIWGFNAGLPAMADTIVPMGQTDLLISFIYRLGFSASNAADYGFSAAITVILFVFVGLMVWLQTRNAASIKEAR